MMFSDIEPNTLRALIDDVFEEFGLDSRKKPTKPIPNPCGEGRVPLCVEPETRRRLRKLLSTPDFEGVGYTGFVNHALAAAEADPRKFLKRK